MDVSICIVNWNTGDLLYKCIKSLKEKTSGLKYEIIIVDNNSIDGSIEFVKRDFNDCIIIENRENLGFARANNAGVKRASGKYVLYLNPDTELITNAIYGMFLHLESNQDIGAAGCRLVHANGNIQYTCASTFISPFNEACSLLFLNRIFPNIKFFSSRELDYWDHLDSRRVDCLSGACIFVRKNLVDEIGGFDEKIFMYAEDLDLCYRIKEKGWSIKYLSNEVILHNEGTSSNKVADKNFAVITQKESNAYFLQKNFGYAKKNCYKMAVCIGSLSRIFLIVLSFPLFLKIVHNDKHAFRSLASKYGNLFLWSIGLK